MGLSIDRSFDRLIDSSVGGSRVTLSSFLSWCPLSLNYLYIYFMQPVVVTSKILKYFSFFFFPWFFCWSHVAGFINWFTFTFRWRLPADAAAAATAQPSLDFVRNFWKTFCFFIFIGDGHEFTPLNTSNSVVYEFPLMIKYFGNFIMYVCVWVCAQTCTNVCMYTVCACRYLWNRDAFDFWFRFWSHIFVRLRFELGFFLLYFAYQFSSHTDSHTQMYTPRSVFVGIIIS